MGFAFEDLHVYQRALDFAVSVIDAIDVMDTPRKHFRLIEQLEASCTSVALNIAEGKGRQYNKEFIQFLYIAIGSLFEVLTLTEIFKRRKLFKEKEAIQIRNKAKIIYRKTTALIKSLRRRT